MTHQQFRRLIALFLVASFLVAGVIIKLDLDRIYSRLQYVYDPWIALELPNITTEDTAYMVSILPWGPGSNDEIMLNIYERAGYRPCLIDLGYPNDFLPACGIAHQHSLGSFTITFPGKGSADNIQEMAIPEISLVDDVLAVRDVAVYLADGRFNPENIRLTDKLVAVARDQYADRTSSAVLEKTPIWLAVAFAPTLLLVLMAALASWVRTGRPFGRKKE